MAQRRPGVTLSREPLVMGAARLPRPGRRAHSQYAHQRPAGAMLLPARPHARGRPDPLGAAMTSTNPMRDESRRTDPPRDVPGLNTYRVQGDSPLLPFPFVADVVASSERAAISRCRGTAFHVYRSPAVFDWDWSVLTVNTGINFDLGES